MFAETRLVSDKELYDSIVHLIKTADRDLKISSPWIYNCDHLLDEIRHASARKVKITVVMRPIQKDIGEQNYRDKAIALEKLRTAKANILFDPYVHEKIVIADGSRMLISSANLIGTSLTRNGESGTYTTDENQIRKYEARLKSKYAGAPPPSKPQSLFKGLPPSVFVISFILFSALLMLFWFSGQPQSSPEDLSPSQVLSSSKLGDIVKLRGTVQQVLADYTSQRGNVFQQFFVTDGAKSIKVFCQKDQAVELRVGDSITLTGKFQTFGGEYEIVDFPCSGIEKI